MKKGYSIVVTSTDSGNSKYFFLSKRALTIILFLLIVILVIAVINMFSYTRIYYRAFEATALRRRNVEIEEAFKKIEEIKRNLEIAEMNNQKIKIMLGVEQSPVPVEPYREELDSDYAEQSINYLEAENNVPSLLPARGQISRNFDPKHRGIDIAAPRFSAVIATASGLVTAAGWDSLYGNYIVLEHNRNYSTFYGHLYDIGAKKGTRVLRGEVIGTIGSSGKSTSPHLHYEVRLRGTPIDPIVYIPNFVRL